jgi:hypothetical protein
MKILSFNKTMLQTEAQNRHTMLLQMKHASCFVKQNKTKQNKTKQKKKVNIIKNKSTINSDLSSGMYCRVKQLSTDVSEVRAASIIALMMEAARISETSVDNYFTRQYIPEDKCELHTRRRENLKPHIPLIHTYSVHYFICAYKCNPLSL